jgi:PAS domain S-box-containing protein
MMAALRRLPVLDRVAAGYAAVFFACLGLKAVGIDVPVVLDVAFYPLGLVLGWANWRNSNASGLDRRTRIAWRLLAAASLVLWATGSVWTLWVTIGRRNAVVDLLDRGAMIQYVLAIAAYLWFPSRPLPQKGTRRFATDVAFIVVAGAAIAFYMGLKVARHRTLGDGALVILESSLDWALFVVAAVACALKRDRVTRQTVTVLLVANLMSLVGNYIFARTPVYRSGDAPDVFWFAAWVLRWSAARYAWCHYSAPCGATADHDEPFEYPGNPFAYVLVAGAFMLLFSQILARDAELLPVLAASAIAMSALLILRQFAEVQENRRLVRTRVERESRFTSLVANSSDVVLVVGADGLITYVSPSLTRVFGPDVRLASGDRLFDVLSAQDARQLSSILAAGGEGTPRFEGRIQVAPGRWREVEAVWSDRRDDPAIGGIVVNCRDVTDRNEIGRHLRHAQKLDAMGHLAGGLAHDLNNVLAVIRGYAELIQEDSPAGWPGAGDLDQIVKAVDRAAAVTQKVLAFSRKQSGRRTLVDLNDVIRELQTMLAHLMKDQVDVQLVLEPGLWPVLADQGQIEQVLVNLATNARDAMPRGGVLQISTANRSVAGNPADPRSAPGGDYAAVVVRDEGVGMPPSLVARIFEPFFSTKPQDRGIGLGLAIVHGIITDLDGRVLVESIEGRGSTLTLLIPRAPSALPSALQAD